MTFMPSTRFFARLSILSLPLVLMGAHGQCDIIPQPACNDVAAICEDGEEYVDTDGDGCQDSCEPVVNCLAIPVCAEGETQVDGPSGCLQDDAVCYEASECGTTIWCTGPDDGVTSCWDDSECGSGEYCDTVNFCESSCGPGERPEGDAALCEPVCYGRCVEDVICPAIDIVCLDGETPVDSNDDGCIDSCEPESQCEAYPSCDAGHTEIDDASGCLQDDAVCYERTLCGNSIWCTGPDAPIDG